MRVTVLCSGDPAWVLGLAACWAVAGDTVTVVLLDAAAGSVRAAHPDAPALASARAAGVTVAAHDEALRRRGIVDAGPAVVDLDEIADLVSSGADKAVWL